MFDQKKKEFVIGGGVPLKDMPDYSIGGGNVSEHMRSVPAKMFTREEVLLGHYSYAILQAMDKIIIETGEERVPLSKLKDEKLKQIYMDSVIYSVNKEIMSWIKKDEKGEQFIEIPEKKLYEKEFEGCYDDMLEMTLVEAGYNMKNAVLNDRHFLPNRFKGMYRLEERKPLSAAKIANRLDERILDERISAFQR